MLAYFISDLHLDPSRPALKDILLRFLADRARDAAALYILGDLFETWIGDDDANGLAVDVAHALHALADTGTEIYFICGNRDFLLGREYASRAGMRRLPDPSVVDLGGIATLITHGDALCTSDIAYQHFRKQVRDPDWQAAFLSQPVAARRAFAAEARTASAEHQRGTNSMITDVDDHAVESLFASYGVDRVVHGHTHRPAEHQHIVTHRARQRIVLADWRECGEALAVSELGVNRVELR